MVGGHTECVCGIEWWKGNSKFPSPSSQLPYLLILLLLPSVSSTHSAILRLLSSCSHILLSRQRGHSIVVEISCEGCLGKPQLARQRVWMSKLRLVSPQPVQRELWTMPQHIIGSFDIWVVVVLRGDGGRVEKGKEEGKRSGGSIIRRGPRGHIGCSRRRE